MPDNGGKYSLGEVSRHDRAEDLWIVIHGKVYDLTRFLKEHPGGEEVLLNSAGKDGTTCFDDIGHSMEAIKLRDGFEIGEVAEKSEDPGNKEAEHRATTQPAADDDDWEYQEPDKKTSPMLPVFVTLGVIVYAVVFYYLWY
ncbi:cytochrome b5 [Orussus abietinus]|uniref:cytochrome b5 n=1 Tax=Orussus abietinus TaxID=222816 RepID=UPI0006258E79|nr:cytochrome b5 [Orussus abietinus]